MKSVRAALLIALALTTFAWCAVAGDPSQRIRVLLVTVGHDFEREAFFKLFSDNPDIEFKAVEHPKAHAFLRPDAATNYDLLVAYDMHQEISEIAKADLLNWLKQGKGFVVLHHAIASYQAWPEYAKIIGARYYLQDTNVGGVKKLRSTYQHGVHFQIHVVDPTHPATRGVKDFEIYDETYNLFDVESAVQPLLTTDEPLSNHIIGWAKQYGPARIVYLQSGHDHFAYENPNYQKILKQSLRWAAQRD